MFTNVYHYLLEHVYLLPQFTHVYLCLLVFNYVYTCLPVYPCLDVFTNVYHCLLVHVYLFTPVYRCF